MLWDAGNVYKHKEDAQSRTTIRHWEKLKNRLFVDDDRMSFIPGMVNVTFFHSKNIFNTTRLKLFLVGTKLFTWTMFRFLLTDFYFNLLNQIITFQILVTFVAFIFSFMKKFGTPQKMFCNKT